MTGCGQDKIYPDGNTAEYKGPGVLEAKGPQHVKLQREGCRQSSLFTRLVMIDNETLLPLKIWFQLIGEYIFGPSNRRRFSRPARETVVRVQEYDVSGSQHIQCLGIPY